MCPFCPFRGVGGGGRRKGTMRPFICRFFYFGASLRFSSKWRQNILHEYNLENSIKFLPLRMFALVSPLNLAIKNINMPSKYPHSGPLRRSGACPVAWLLSDLAQVVQRAPVEFCKFLWFITAEKWIVNVGQFKKPILPTSPIVQWPTLHMGVSLPCCSPSFSDLAQFVRRADSKILHTFMNNCRDLVEKTPVSQIAHSAVAHLAQGS